MRRVRGFTLIELLVVISVIAMLMSILMPALQKAKATAQRVVCSSNIRNLTLANLTYAADHDDKVVLAISASGDLWLASLEPYYGDPKIKMCPSAKNKATGRINNSNSTSGPLGGQWAKIDPVDGSCYESWWAQTNDLFVHTSSYGINGYAQWPEDIRFGTQEEDYWGKTTDPRASKIPLFAPDIWRSGYAGKGAIISANVEFTDIPGECNDPIGRFVFIRHGDKNNVAFADGHVERVYLPDMGKLHWSRIWEPIVLDIPWLD